MNEIVADGLAVAVGGTGEGVAVGAGVRVGGSSVALGATVGWVQAVRARVTRRTNRVW